MARFDGPNEAPTHSSVEVFARSRAPNEFLSLSFAGSTAHAVFPWATGEKLDERETLSAKMGGSRLLRAPRLFRARRVKLAPWAVRCRSPLPIAFNSLARKRYLSNSYRISIP